MKHVFLPLLVLAGVLSAPAFASSQICKQIHDAVNSTAPFRHMMSEADARIVASGLDHSFVEAGEYGRRLRQAQAQIRDKNAKLEALVAAKKYVQAEVVNKEIEDIKKSMIPNQRDYDKAVRAIDVKAASHGLNLGEGRAYIVIEDVPVEERLTVKFDVAFNCDYAKTAWRRSVSIGKNGQIELYYWVGEPGNDLCTSVYAAEDWANIVAAQVGCKPN